MSQFNGYTEQVYAPDDFLKGSFPVLSKNILLYDADGDGLSYSKLDMLGLIDREVAATSVVKTFSTAVATIEDVAMGINSKVGAYKVECYDVISTLAYLRITDPDGVMLNVITTTTSTDITYSDSNIEFKLNTVTTNFAVGDYFTLNISANTDGYYVVAKKSAVDGSREPKCILASDIVIADNSGTASSEKAKAFITGQFDSTKVELDSSWAVSEVEDSLLKRSIFLS